MDIGKKLRELRKQNDLTLEDLASRSELTKGFLSQVERNLTAPSIATLADRIRKNNIFRTHYWSLLFSYRNHINTLIHFHKGEIFKKGCLFLTENAFF